MDYGRCPEIYVAYLRPFFIKVRLVILASYGRFVFVIGGIMFALQKNH